MVHKREQHLQRRVREYKEQQFATISAYEQRHVVNREMLVKVHENAQITLASDDKYSFIANSADFEAELDR